MPVIALTLARFDSVERSLWIDRSCAVLAPGERERVASIRDPDARAQHAIGRALLRLMAARAGRRAPADVRIAVTATGKPWLPEQPGLHVNVSHAGRAVVVAASRHAPVGVDIEPPATQLAEPRRLARRAFAPAEVGALDGLSDDAVPGWFSSVWTIKEAVAKALGMRLMPALSQVIVESGASELSLKAVAPGPPVESWTLHQLVAPGGSEKVAVACPSPGVALAPISSLSLERFARSVDAQGATARRCAGSARRRARR